MSSMPGCFSPYMLISSTLQTVFGYDKRTEQEKQAKQPQRSGQSSPLRQEMRVGEKAGGESDSVGAGAGSKSGEAEKSPEAKTGGTKPTEAKAK